MKVCELLELIPKDDWINIVIGFHDNNCQDIVKKDVERIEIDAQTHIDVEVNVITEPRWVVLNSLGSTSIPLYLTTLEIVKIKAEYMGIIMIEVKL